MSDAFDALKQRVKDLETLTTGPTGQAATISSLLLRTTAVEASYVLQDAALQALILRTGVLEVIPLLRKYLPVDPILNVELVSGSESPLVRAYNELPILQPGVDKWLYFANLPVFLKEIAVTTAVNEGDLLFYVKQPTVAYLMRSEWWNEVDLTGWTELVRGNFVGPVKKECIVYTKTLEIGEHTLSNTTAIYFFAD